MKTKASHRRKMSFTFWQPRLKGATKSSEAGTSETSSNALVDLDGRPIWKRGPVPVVGVVTPVRNRKSWSLSFLRQMLSQSYPFLRIYIVDADSTDGTPEAITSLGSSAVELVQVASSNFWTGATNAGVRRALEAGCDYILTINDDAVVPRLFVEKLVTSALIHDLKLVGSIISYASSPGRIWGIGAYNDWENGNFLQTKYANQWADSIVELESDLVEAECLCGNGTLIHRSVFEEIGLYNLKYTPHYHADTEFTLRARRHGIKAFVATDAWIYNRFFEETDGAMAARNRRYFSLRSSNYIKAMLFLVTKYCPPSLQSVAFCRYIERYIHDATPRTVSIIVRIALQLSRMQEQPRIQPRSLLSAGFENLDFCRDILEVLELDPSQFLQIAPLLILRRPLNTVETDHYRKFVETIESRRVVLLDLMKRPEFGAMRSKTADLSALLGEWDTAIDCVAVEECTDESFLISAYWLSQRRLPTTAELKLHLEELLSRPRAALFPNLFVNQQAKQISFSSGKGVIKTPYDKPIVYMNADVLCMAQLDERARTGVFRYASSLATQLRRDGRIVLKLFHSEGLSAGWQKLIGASPELAELLIHKPLRDGDVSKRDIVFFPYFPYTEFDNRFLDQTRVFTLCDLFPVTHPEWFTKEATINFLRQLRHLISSEHIFCISAETQRTLRGYAPTLRASSSVTHLGVTRPPDGDGRGAGTNVERGEAKKYMLCIGTLEPRKNLATVINAFSRLSLEDSHDVHLVVVGASGWNVDFAKETSLLRGRISFLGHVSDADLWALYGGAICTVFPSLAEGFGFPIIESFASGTPVITSNRSSMAEIAGNSAVLVDPLDETAIANAMKRILRDAKLREQLSLQGLERAKAFTWETCANLHAEQFLRTFHRVR